MAKPKISVTFNAVDKVSKPIKGMNRKVTGFSRSASRSFGGVAQSIGRMRNLLIGAGAAIATGKIAQQVNEFTKLGDEIGKTSRQLGIGVEALQEFRFVAERQGVSVDNLEKSMKAMNNRLGKLRAGQGQLSTMLEDTNPQLKEQLVNTEDSEEAFMLLMQAMNEAETAAEKTALAQAAFSSSGRELVRISEAGAEGIADLRQQARETGNVMSEEATRGSEKFQDAMTNLKNVMSGLRNDALVPLIQKLTPLIKNVTEWIQENEELIKSKVNDFLDKMKDTVQLLIRAWQSGLIPAVLAGIVAFKTLVPIIWGIQKAVLAWKAGQIALNVVLAANPVGIVVAALSTLAGLFVLLWKRSEKFRQMWKNIGAFIKGYFQGVIEIIQKTIDIAKKAADVVGLGKKDNSGRQGIAGASLGGGGPVSANKGVQESRSVNESRVTLDINGAPQGSSVKQKGQAPGFAMNVGYQGATP